MLNEFENQSTQVPNTQTPPVSDTTPSAAVQSTAPTDAANGAQPQAPAQTPPPPQQTYPEGMQSAPSRGINPYTNQPFTTPYAASAGGNTAFNSAPYGAPGTAPTPEPEKKPKKKASMVQKICATLVLALIFGVVSGAVIRGMTGNTVDPSSGYSDPAGDPNPGNTIGVSSGNLSSAADLMQQALERAELATKDILTIPQINIIMEPAMVSINCIVETTVQSFFGYQTYESQSAGSGIIVGENETELLIVTNNHVIDEAKEIKVQFTDGESYPALVKGTDATNDLAVIVVKLEDISENSMKAIAYAELGDSDALVIGEGVVAIGNAAGIGQSVTDGIVSALNREVEDSNGNTAKLIQTNAAINPGNSGGALVNMRGQVIGINSSKFADEAIEGMGFAIPINTALPILEELMSRETRVEIEDPSKAGYLGITPQDVSSSMAQAYGMPVGVYVYEVTEGSAADRAGLVRGDIITKFDRETIASVSALQKTLSYYEAGETVTLTVQRIERGEYVEEQLTVTLGARPAEEAPKAEGNRTDENEGETNQGGEVPSWWDFFGGR